MSFTYDQLKAAIQAYTDNDETTFVSNLDTFIKIAEERILKSVQLSLFRKNSTARTTINYQYLPVPSDYLSTFSLSLEGSNGDKVFVELKDPSFIQTYTPDSKPRWKCPSEPPVTHRLRRKTEVTLPSDVPPWYSETMCVDASPLLWSWYRHLFITQPPAPLQQTPNE